MMDEEEFWLEGTAFARQVLVWNLYQQKSLLSSSVILKLPFFPGQLDLPDHSPTELVWNIICRRFGQISDLIMDLCRRRHQVQVIWDSLSRNSSHYSKNATYSWDRVAPIHYWNFSAKERGIWGLSGFVISVSHNIKYPGIIKTRAVGFL